MSPRNPRPTVETVPGGPVELLAEAQAAVERAQAIVEACRQRVQDGQDTGASIATAEYRLAGAVRRLSALGGPPEAA